MTTERWRRVQELFDEAVELSPAEREALLAIRCGDDRELRREVDSLFAYDEPESGQPLDSVVRDAAVSLMSAQAMVGRRIGAYRLTAQLGTGGMGTVYLGVRDDAQFEQRVAIKLVRAGLNTHSVLERFRYERRILAQLDHPYVGKLLDGGTTSDGFPYFVMEHVEGTPIHRYCAGHDFTPQQKCELFAKVCEAVAYAHRNLVIHRDLKPSNILVREDGTPKLLDFGIAKLLTPDEAERVLTQTGQLAQPLTPDYASPEQVVGDAFNTTTDVYSLGAVLFELLTGTRPHRIGSLTPLALERAICLEEVRKPSTVCPPSVRRQLTGDLDNIVLMAMRKEPLRRYQSAGELREDILRHLRGLPVAAREDTLWYRSGKFVRRHHVAVFAASMVFLALGAGVVATDRERLVAEAQKRAAEAQRQTADRERARAQAAHAEANVQRDSALRAQQQAEAQSHEAGEQRQRAEERLREMLGIADKSLFSIQDEIATLPGGTELRKKIVQETVEYLDRLAVHANGDRRIEEMLMNGYTALGDVQGYPFRPNLGDSAGATESYRKADTILSSLLRRFPNDEEVLVEAVGLHQRRGETMAEHGQREEGRAQLLKGLAAAEKLIAAKPGQRRSTVQLAVMHHSLAQFLMNGDIPAAAQHARQEQALYARLAEADPKDIEAVNALASAYLLLSTAEAYEGRRAEGVEYLRRAAAVREGLTARFPNDVLIARNLLVTYGRLADNLGGPYLSRNLGDTGQAIEYYRKALAIAERLAHADTSDRLAKSDVATALMRLGMTLDRPEDLEESLAALRRSEALLKELQAADPGNPRERRSLIIVYEYLGHRMEQQGKREDAVNYYRTSLEISEALVAKDPTTSSTQIQADYKALALVYAAMGRRADALQFAGKMVSRAEELASSTPVNNYNLALPPRSYEVNGRVYETLARAGGVVDDWSQARAWYARSRDAWMKLGAIPALRPLDDEIARVTGRLAECERELSRF